MNWFPTYNFILASKSPRRQQLLQALGIEFTVQTKEVEEVWPAGLAIEEVPVYLAELKADAFNAELGENDVVITADTVVCLGPEVLGKPESFDEACAMLHRLSGREHQVITGVCLTSSKKRKSFYSVTNVEFKTLTAAEIEYYVTHFKPYDKAGAYGIQEWIGSIGIKHIEGSFYNVMGLPIQKLYEYIQSF
ncbi:Maf family nucleotide pyrophosphatase [Maribellus sp. YY47]|uniref:Maf family nucleotide pyrophosphatase n=1 Tax=Maribellus sp. YY47 TaxID=2929486 RepID=UPI0020017240|nr:Maf family nucleotide pyrophosphatase [Maribellus sp. YY47]MCK3685676.1 Maf family nucleotide pyrophosphatase [Maribellus sp. YY47]